MTLRTHTAAGEDSGFIGSRPVATGRSRNCAKSRPAVISLRIIENPDELAQHAAEIEALGNSSITANIFYERSMLFPALKAFGANRTLLFVLAYANEKTGGSRRPRLCGFIPLERRSSFRRIPIPVLTLWRYRHNFLSTPLLRNGYAFDVLSAFFDWTKTDGAGAAVLELPHVSASGPFHSALERALAHHPELQISESRFQRALFQPMTSAQQYLRTALSQKKRKEHRRQERRLSECGQLAWDELNDGGDVTRWVNEFLRLESSGWKGRTGTALASSPEDREFFHTIANAAHSQNRLLMLALRLNGRAIAMKCNLMTTDGGFAFKIAYDERFRQFSPGLLLELEHIKRMHQKTEVRWIDSCAAPDHFMANRIWIHRRPLRTVTMSTGGKVGALFVRAIDVVKRASTWAARNGLHRGITAGAG